MADSFLPYGRQTITEADIVAVEKVLRSPFITQGPIVPAFEKAMAVKVSAAYGVAVNSATSALHIACLALGLGPGDRLWTSPITFVASANCARYCGADVDFVDIEPSTGLMSVKCLEEKLKKAALDGSLPKVVVPVHLCGTSCNMEAIGQLAEQFGFVVLEDASHAIGGRYRDEPVGSCRHSAITVFSFHPVKIITTGEGGMAMTNDPHLAMRMTELRSHGITKDQHRFVYPAHGPWSYEQQTLGYNYRMTDLQAALGLSQLMRLDEIVAERNKQLKIYEQLLENLPCRILEIPDDVLSSVHLAVVYLEGATRDLHRRVFEGLRSSGIGVQLHYNPVHLQPYYRNMGFSEGHFPEAETYANKAISIPLFPGLQYAEQQTISSKIRTLLK